VQLFTQSLSRPWQLRNTLSQSGDARARADDDTFIGSDSRWGLHLSKGCGSNLKFRNLIALPLSLIVRKQRPLGRHTHTHHTLVISPCFS
jgi:hypothetical protein